MTHLINVPRYTFIVSVFLIFFLFSPMAAGKHIIVIYDVSGSMVRLSTDIYMESKDIRRVNEYLTNLLFTNTSQALRDKVNDSYIKECDAAYVGKPLYQSGDILTYAEYAKQRTTKINRAQVSKSEFQRQLPDPMTLKTSFYGMVSYLLRAEVEVYDELYRDADDETYWVFVTDGDIDNSGESDPGISSVLKRHAEIEAEFYSPMIFGVLVNNRVRVQVRKLRKSIDINTIFFATPTKPGKSVEEIQLTKDNEGKFISETLTVETHNNFAKSNLKLNSVNVEIVDKFNKPLQIMKDNKFNVVIVPPVSLDGNPPPFEFRIQFPAHREIAAPGNALKLEAPYSFKGEDKIHSPQPIKYTAVIDSIYVSSLNSPEQQTKELNLDFSESTYHADLVIQSESYDKKAFEVDQVRCYIQYKDGGKLCDATVPKEIELGESFSIEVAKQDRLDWYGNKFVFEIDYKYEKEAKFATIEMPYKLVGGGTGFPMWLLWVLLVPVLGVVVFLLIRKIIDSINPQIIEHRITLTIEDETRGLVPNDKKPFTLTDKNSLAFGENNAHELHFDVGWPDCHDYLRCEKYSPWLWSKEKGRIRHYKSIDDTEGRVLDLPETLTLTREEDNGEIRVRCEIVDKTPISESDDDKVTVGSNSTPPVDPLKI